MSITRITRAPVSRGCGSRASGGIYACCGLSENGSPIEQFLIDPVTRLPISCFRAPILIGDPQLAEVRHIAVWVGAEFYPSPWDFIEEVRRLGASRRIPGDFDFSRLTPGLSRMVLVHPRAATWRIDLPDECPKNAIDRDGHGVSAPCLGALRHYVGALGSKVDLAGSDGRGLRIVVGDSDYFVPTRQIDEAQSDQFSSGAFMQLPITHFEYQAKDRADHSPLEFAERCEKSGFEGLIVDDIDN